MSVILIVGGASGSGGTLARHMRDKGDSVVIADPAATECIAGEPRGRLFAVDCDLLDPQSPDNVLAFCHQQAGPPDGLFINMNRSSEAPLDEWSAMLFDRDLLANLTMPFLFARAVALDMQKRRHGAIVLTSSTAGLNGSAKKAPFHAAKAAISGLARALADELGPYNIRVNCLLPGWINSPFGSPNKQSMPAIPLGRLGEMDDVAAAAAFLFAEPYIHGTDLIVDGGFTAAGTRQTHNNSATI
jgi:3-oxoacyl-[acyl-carrier protein] reductase